MAAAADKAAADKFMGLSTDAKEPAKTLQRKGEYWLCDTTLVDYDTLRMMYDKCRAYKQCETNFQPTPEGFSYRLEWHLVDVPWETALKKAGYLYDAESNIREQGLDEHDKAFLAALRGKSEPEGLIKKELFGLHTYGGYYGFFRPDLWEVISMMLVTWSREELQAMKRFYVTTEAWPSDKVWDCYDNKADRHQARTTIYYSV